LNHHVEESPKMSQVWLFARPRQEARHVVGIGDVVFAIDADEQAQRRIAIEVFEAGLGGVEPQRDRKEVRAPEDFDGKVVAALTTDVAQRAVESLIGNSFEQEADGLEGESSSASQSNRGLLMATFMTSLRG
jgi:hypothetical protein